MQLPQKKALLAASIEKSCQLEALHTHFSGNRCISSKDAAGVFLHTTLFWYGRLESAWRLRPLCLTFWRGISDRMHCGFGL
jgi:hypothetical protein